MRKIVSLILTCLFAVTVFADTATLQQITGDLVGVGGHPQVVEEYKQYTRIQLTDSATLEIYDSYNYIVVMTVCAPQCSSCARVYNKVGEYLFALEPSVTSVFPLATMDKETGSIEWTDNDTWEY